VATTVEPYAARLDIEYPDRLDRLTTLLRLIWVIPIAIVYSMLSATRNETVITQTGQRVQAWLWAGTRGSPGVLQNNPDQIGADS
jgi:hypothetical protein